jgi:type I restriction enzyme S subunit
MLVPEGWRHEKLENVAFLQRGFDLPTSNRVTGKVPIISSGGISGYHNLAQCQAPGVVTGRYGSIGDVFFVEEEYWPLNTSLWVKNFCGNNPKYIYYLLSKIDFAKFSDKTGVPGINRNDLHAIKVPVPPLPEQQKIAQILSTWDKAIEKLEALITSKQKRKKALMQQLLTGKKRFSGFDEPWMEVSMGDVFKRVTRKNTEVNTNVVTISAQKGLIKQDEFFNKSIASELLDYYFLLKIGEFAYNKCYSNGYPMGAVK